MDEKTIDLSTKRKTRPTQRLYVPPAQRKQKAISITSTDIPKDPEKEIPNNVEEVEEIQIENISPPIMEVSTKLKSLDNKREDLIKIKSDDSTNNEELVLMLKEIRMGSDCNELDAEKEKTKTEELHRETLNVNRKTKKVKHVSEKNDLLKIETKKPSNKSIKKSPVKLTQVANWEDLFLEDDQEDNYNNQLDYIENEADEIQHINNDPKMQQLDHVIELYDFPESFKSLDIMQIYNNINKDSMYIKWCDETHALLVLGSSIQAKHALDLKHDIIKSRPMTMAGALATEVAVKCDLKPAMKRPETSMQTARRMITTALGTKTQISRELQEKEREALRKAKELKRTQRQNEKDAWEGNPRPSTA